MFEKSSQQPRQSESGEKRLITDLLSDYDPRVRPTTNSSQPIDVSVLFIFNRLESLDERKQTLTSFGLVYLFWRDEFIQWNPADYNGTDRIILPPNTVWMPEISVENSIQDLQDLALDTDFRVEVRNTGIVSWSPGFRWETSCEVDMTLFPYDIQTCTVSLINWVYREKGIRFLKYEPGIWFGNFIANGEWEIIQSVMIADYKQYESPPLILPRAYFTLKLRRNPSYYNLFTLMPCVIVFTVSMLTFCLPAEEQEKVTLGVTVCLSYLVTLTMVLEATPSTGSVPRFAQFIILAMFLTALSLVQAIFTLRIFFHTPLQPVPGWALRVFLDIIGPKLGFAKFIKKDRLRGLSVFQQYRGEDNMLRLRDTRRKKGTESPKLDPIPIIYTDSDEETDNLKKQISFLELEDILTEIKKIVNYLNKQEFELNEETNRRNWEMVSRVFDRVCMVVFFILCLLLVMYNGIDLYILYKKAEEEFEPDKEPF